MSRVEFPGFIQFAFRVAIEQARNSPLIAEVQPAAPWKRLIAFIALSALLMATAMVAAILLTLPFESAGLLPSDLFAVAPEGPNRLWDENVSVLALGLMLGLMGGAILLAAKIVYRAPVAAFLWPGRRLSWRQLGIGFAVMSVVGGVSVLVYNLIDPIGPPPIFNPAYSIESRLTYILAASVGLLVAAAAEEVAFRGVLLRVTGGLTRSLILLCLINALIFSAVHLDPDPVAFVARALSGLVWTWAALRLGGIEFAIGAHWANNLAIALLGEPLSGAGLPAEAIPVSALALEFVSLVVVLAAAERLDRDHDHAARLQPPEQVGAAGRAELPLGPIRRIIGRQRSLDFNGVAAVDAERHPARGPAAPFAMAGVHSALGVAVKRTAPHRQRPFNWVSTSAMPCVSAQ
ncbi:CPBP family intramembrane glutamic endopeptidase [Brevundimonas diminuta]|uniref:CAAX amino terminal protease self- immunity n=1 Tax=Brevundimonas diminuta TaxID=293 RepID=A0A2X1C4C7_BREDI|nr:CAAX amino terminal protease self- immunity [Brevundimonas diminuta]